MAAVTSKQQEIIEAVVTRLATINGTGDYNTDFDGRVADSRTDWTAGDPETDQDSELPAASVFELPVEVTEASQQHGRRKVIHIMPLLIKIFLRRETTPENARLAVADVMRAILGTGTQADNWLAERFPDGSGKGLTMETRPRRHGIEYAEGSFEIVGANVEIEIIFITPKWEM